MNPKVNAMYAALYLKYQESVYGDNWVKIVAAYNAGSYFESSKNPGCPTNSDYVKKVKEKLPLDLQDRLRCGRNWELAEGV